MISTVRPFHSSCLGSPNTLGVQVQQLANQLGVQTVTTAVSLNPANQITSYERDVANHVEQLMPCALILEVKLVLNRALLVEHQQVAETYPAAQSLLAQCLGFLLSNECPCRRNPIGEVMFAQHC
jgi:hypothetical protein